ncbi:chromate transporter [Schinkia azotoformans]|uniref:Chromate transporter n=1 Tax=Schinkia azotoformans LMG 9581 TaxID=1131731 RepID=K6D8D9_SCHAZ|nr:chromate transporter [Schinkia azotoformans]EKN64358.1 Chromate transporter [Schinkia azotoformans LMG 9581]MEC1637934.1 chromate transporter [Schinkia azotoformans]MEC1721674.1 chromate transporter [Schinkia azotoformans]MEC1944831.1 chromate transporter [Schinkia azotoformans]MED4415060.1 chromate transporter [Schinkia azotoformans]
MGHLQDLTIGFARTGLTGYGGGPSTIPLIEYEAVKRYRWMTEDEFGDTLALANTLPGPIATKMAAYIGYKVKGSVGATVAILAHILPSIIGMLGLLGVLYTYKDSPFVKGMVLGVAPIIALMLAEMCYKFFIKGNKGLGININVVLSIVSLIALAFLNIHPGIVIAVFLLAAFLIATFKQKAHAVSPAESVKKRRESV